MSYSQANSYTSKNTSFSRELQAKMKERKRQGLTTDLTSESSRNNSDDELPSDNDLLRSFDLANKARRSPFSKKNSPRNIYDDSEMDETDMMMTLKKPWKPNQGHSQEPKPSPRVSTKSHALDILNEEPKWTPPRRSSKPNTRENSAKSSPREDRLKDNIFAQSRRNRGEDTIDSGPPTPKQRSSRSPSSTKYSQDEDYDRDARIYADRDSRKRDQHSPYADDIDRRKSPLQRSSERFNNSIDSEENSRSSYRRNRNLNDSFERKEPQTQYNGKDERDKLKSPFIKERTDRSFERKDLNKKSFDDNKHSDYLDRNKKNSYGRFHDEDLDNFSKQKLNRNMDDRSKSPLSRSNSKSPFIKGVNDRSFDKDMSNRKNDDYKKGYSKNNISFEKEDRRKESITRNDKHFDKENSIFDRSFDKEDRRSPNSRRYKNSEYDDMKNDKNSNRLKDPFSKSNKDRSFEANDRKKSIHDRSFEKDDSRRTPNVKDDRRKSPYDKSFDKDDRRKSPYDKSFDKDDRRKSPYDKSFDKDDRRKSPYDKSFDKDKDKNPFSRSRKGESEKDNQRKSPYDKSFDKDDRRKSPNDRSFDKDDRRRTPYDKDDRRNSPYDKSFDKDDRRRTPYDKDNRRKSPNDRSFDKDDRRRTPYDKDDRRKSPNDRSFDKDDRRKSPYDKSFDKDDRRRTPYDKDDRRKSPNDRSFDKDDRRKSPYDKSFERDDRRRSPYDKEDQYNDDRRYKLEDRDRGRRDDRYDRGRSPNGRDYSPRNRSSPYTDKSRRGNSQSPDPKSRNPARPFNDSRRPSLRKDSVPDKNSRNRRTLSTDEVDSRSENSERTKSSKNEGRPTKEQIDRRRREIEEEISSNCEEYILDPSKQIDRQYKPETKEKRLLTKIIDEVSREQNTMKYIDPDHPGNVSNTLSAFKKTKKPKPRYAIVETFPAPKKDNSSPQLNNTISIRDQVFRDWYDQRLAKTKNDMKLDKSAKKEEEQRLLMEKRTKKLEAKATYDAWVEKKERNKPDLRKENRIKNEKEHDELNKKKMRIKEAKKCFEVWKESKDRELWRKQEKKIYDKKESEEEDRMKKRRKQREAEKTFNEWKRLKEESISNESKKKTLELRKDHFETKSKDRRRKNESKQSYNDWMQNKMQKEKFGTKNSLENLLLTQPAWSPASNTIPFGH